MVNAVLPFMRQQKRGHIINISSLSGLSAIPFLGIYSASKFALEGYTEALRHEVKPFNIHVSLAEAGFLRTPMRRRAYRPQYRFSWSIWRVIPAIVSAAAACSCTRCRRTTRVAIGTS